MPLLMVFEKRMRVETPITFVALKRHIIFLIFWKKKFYFFIFFYFFFSVLPRCDLSWTMRLPAHEIFFPQILHANRFLSGWSIARIINAYIFRWEKSRKHCDWNIRRWMRMCCLRLFSSGNRRSHFSHLKGSLSSMFSEDVFLWTIVTSSLT